MAIAVKQKRKPTVHHRKRHGVHQRRSHRFVKTYWPYIPLLVIVGAGLIMNSLWLRPSVLSYATNMTHGGLLDSTNSERAKNNLGSLALSNTLSQAAQAKANDMVARNYWSHTTPDGQEPWIFINQTGYLYETAGENLAYGFGTSLEAVVGWMNSPGHRANILNATYSEVGFGIANSPSYQGDGEQTIVVAMYAKPVVTARPQPSPAPPVPKPASVVPAQPAPAVPAPPKPQQPATPSPTETPASKPDIKTAPSETKVTWIQMATSGAAPWSAVAAAAAAMSLLLVFVARHSLAWHRAFRRGEKFVLKHTLLDSMIVAAVMVGFILTQTAGTIL